MPIFGPAVAPIPATFCGVAAFLAVPIVEVVMAVLVIGWSAGWRSLTVVAIKQTLFRVTLWVALPIPEEKPATGVGGAALPGVRDPQGAVSLVPVSSWATAASVTGPISTSALASLCSGPLTPGPWRAGGAGASKAWDPQPGGL